MFQKSFVKQVAMVSVMGLGLMAFTGCGSANKHSLRLNPSPELTTRGQTWQDIHNENAITANQDIRSAHQDIRRFLLLDRPSRLNPTPNPW